VFTVCLVVDLDRLLHVTVAGFLDSLKHHTKIIVSFMVSGMVERPNTLTAGRNLNREHRSILYTTDMNPREPTNQCGSMQIRILTRLCRHTFLFFL
jgi:hypothetical protein